VTASARELLDRGRGNCYTAEHGAIPRPTVEVLSDVRPYPRSHAIARATLVPPMRDGSCAPAAAAPCRAATRPTTHATEAPTADALS